MPALISRNPFSRTEVHREVIDAYGQTCSWCGGVRRSGKLFVYYTERDGSGGRNRRTHNGQFCSKSCHDSFHS